MRAIGLSGTLVKYVLAQIPGWFLAMLLAWGLEYWYEVPTWVGLLLVGLWIATDLALFPRIRRFYESTSSESRIIGDTGVCVTELAPHGFVRVYGELWQADAASKKTIPKGARVCVRDIRGLLLIVDAMPVLSCSNVGFHSAPARSDARAHARSSGGE